MDFIEIRVNGEKMLLNVLTIERVTDNGNAVIETDTDRFVTDQTYDQIKYLLSDGDSWAM